MRETSMRDRSRAVASAALRCSPPCAMSLTSPPAQNARPAPVSMTTLTAGSPASRGSPCSNPSMIGVDSAFRRSGRLKVSVAMPSSMVSSSSGWASIFSSVPKTLRGQQGCETAADYCLGLGHDPIDQFPAGRDVVDEPGDHPTAPGACVQLAVLQDAAVPFSANEMANVLHRRGGAVVAFDGEDFLDGRIGQHALGIAQWPHDQPHLQFI